MVKLQIGGIMKSKLKNLLAASIFCAAVLLVGVVVTPDSIAENKQGCGGSYDGEWNSATLTCSADNPSNCTSITVCADQPG